MARGMATFERLLRRFFMDSANLENLLPLKISQFTVCGTQF